MAHQGEHEPGTHGESIHESTEHPEETHVEHHEPLRTIKEAKASKHHRQMSREIRWPVTSTSHKLTW